MRFLSWTVIATMSGVLVVLNGIAGIVATATGYDATLYVSYSSAASAAIVYLLVSIKKGINNLNAIARFLLCASIIPAIFEFRTYLDKGFFSPAEKQFISFLPIVSSLSTLLIIGIVSSYNNKKT